MTTYLPISQTPPDHRLMWNAFRDARAHVEALHGPMRLHAGVLGHEDLPIRLGTFYRMAAVWFLPTESGTLRNNGFHLDLEGPGAWVLSVWTTTVGKLEIRTTTVNPRIVLGALRLAELLPAPELASQVNPDWNSPR